MRKSAHRDIDEIIAKLLSGTLNEAEQSELAAWRNESPEHEALFEQLMLSWRMKYQEPRYINAPAMKSRILAEGFGPVSKPAKTPSPFHHWWRVAAFLVMATGLGFLVYNIDETDHSKPPVAEVVIEKYNPPGVKSRIVLSDGSVVWLNADSKLTYQKGFSPEQRYIELTGEAYFEVAEDTARPFIVKSGAVYTRALGTSFNIRYYEEEPEIDVSLFTGKVQVSTGSDRNPEAFLLHPNEQLNILKDLTSISKTQRKGRAAVAWKDNIIKFENASFDQVIRSLERWYGVRIDASGYHSRSWDYIGEFPNLSLEQVLSRIGYAQGFDFVIDEDQIRIFEKGGHAMK